MSGRSPLYQILTITFFILSYMFVICWRHNSNQKLIDQFLLPQKENLLQSTFHRQSSICHFHLLNFLNNCKFLKGWKGMNFRKEHIQHKDFVCRSYQILLYETFPMKKPIVPPVISDKTLERMRLKVQSLSLLFIISLIIFNCASVKSAISFPWCWQLW